MSIATPALHNRPNHPHHWTEGATLLQGTSSAIYYHLVPPKALEDENSTFYKLVNGENQQNNSRVFIETNDDAIFAIYRRHFPSNNPNEPGVRYMCGSLVELSASERQEIMQKAQDYMEDLHSSRSN